ncbi:ML5 [Symbiodinium sp. CCMP2592]|nr:ML5 [Symbiodinium sp. CCMP2592]
MARPPVTARELVQKAGMDYAETERSLEPQADASARWLYPVSRVWPMGFSWSSYFPQKKLLSVCVCVLALAWADCILATDLPTPHSMAFAAAADDVMLFSNAGPGVTAAAAERLDAAMVSHDVLKNSAKDVTDCLNATCVGVSLENGVQWAVPPERCLALVVCTTQLAAGKQALPEQILQLLGSLQWYDLLRRQQLAVHQQVYKFTTHNDAFHQQLVQEDVLEELLLGCFWEYSGSLTFGSRPLS